MRRFANNNRLKIAFVAPVILAIIISGCSSATDAALKTGLSEAEKTDNTLADSATAQAIELASLRGTIEAISRRLDASPEPTATVAPVPKPTITPTPEPTPTATPVPEPYLPTVFDFRVAFYLDVSNTDSEVLFFSRSVALWLVAVIEQDKARDRNGYQEFVTSNPRFITEELPVGVSTIAALVEYHNSGFLPGWAGKYFLNPSSKEVSYFACFTHRYNGGLFFWARFGVSTCDRIWESWAEAAAAGSDRPWITYLLETD
jgi:hypothetical protein